MSAGVAYTCPTCGVTYHADERPRYRCVSLHPPGECCHYGDWIVGPDGTKVAAVRRGDCEVIDFAAVAG